jgi:fermentation-respiration switch protein FrsA (DUF1100 family)
LEALAMIQRQKILAIFFFGVFFLFSGCANPLFFHPTSEIYQTPSDACLAYEEVVFKSFDNTLLTGWFIPAVSDRPGTVPKGTVVHFHGNAQNMSSHLSLVYWLPAEGYNLFLFDYRGYGRSGGRARRHGIYKDCEAALLHAAGMGDVDSDRIAVLGQSIGGALAIRVVSDHPELGIKAVVSDSAFASYRHIVRDKVDLIPIARWLKYPLSYILATDGYSPVDVIEKLSPTPVVIIHGTSDVAVPFHHGEILFESAKEPKFFWRIEEGRHIDALSPERPECRRKLADFLDSVFQPAL